MGRDFCSGWISGSVWIEVRFGRLAGAIVCDGTSLGEGDEVKLGWVMVVRVGGLVSLRPDCVEHAEKKALINPRMIKSNINR